MLFRRRKQANLWERVRVWLWPRRSFSRSFRYIGKRVLRIQATPHAVALGLAIGVFAAFTPLYGLHVILSIIIAWALSGNVAAAAIGTAFSNPLTIPLVFSATYELGRAVLHVGNQSIRIREFFELLHDWNFAELWIVLLQLFVGSVVLGSIAAGLVYILAFKATTRFRHRRSGQMVTRSKARPGAKCSAKRTKTPNGYAP